MATLEAFRYVASQSVPRLLYGNDAGLANNRDGRAALRRARRAASPTPSGAEAQRLAAQLRQNGWVALPVFPAEVMDPIRSAYETLIQDTSATHDMGGTLPTCVRYVVDPAVRVPQLGGLLDQLVLEALNAYYRAWCQLLHVRMWRISPLPPGEEGRYHYGNVWHTDLHPTSTVKLFVQISPGVTADNGALRLFGLQRTRSIMRTGYLTRTRALGPARRLLEDQSAPVMFDGPPGSAILVSSCLCLHRAGIPVPGQTRGMVQFTFDVAERPPPGGNHLAALRPDHKVIAGLPVG